MKKTNKKVAIKDGQRHHTRAVYEENGKEYFMLNGETWEIEHRENGKLWAPWGMVVKYIAEEQ